MEQFKNFNLDSIRINKYRFVTAYSLNVRVSNSDTSRIVYKSKFGQVLKIINKIEIGHL